MKASDKIALAVLIGCLVAIFGGGGVAPIGPVDSPFPAEGLWVLTASESGELTGVKSITNAESVRNFPGINRRYLDYDKKDVEEPWKSALAWAEQKSGGSPYYVARHGRRTSEGPLEGSVDQMMATLNMAIEGVQ